mmetsp:Transcript_11065/g.27563  ORF Transcript_11065/g.27563 Transcript_11065/m.27563 type:complete len:303 (+) Transcript_11065:806-1714(+)
MAHWAMPSRAWTVPGSRPPSLEQLRLVQRRAKQRGIRLAAPQGSLPKGHTARSVLHRSLAWRRLFGKREHSCASPPTRPARCCVRAPYVSSAAAASTPHGAIAISTGATNGRICTQDRACSPAWRSNRRCKACTPQDVRSLRVNSEDHPVAALNTPHRPPPRPRPRFRPRWSSAKRPRCHRRRRLSPQSHRWLGRRGHKLHPPWRRSHLLRGHCSTEWSPAPHQRMPPSTSSQRRRTTRSPRCCSPRTSSSKPMAPPDLPYMPSLPSAAAERQALTAPCARGTRRCVRQGGSNVALSAKANP